MPLFVLTKQNKSLSGLEVWLKLILSPFTKIINTLTFFFLSDFFLIYFLRRSVDFVDFSISFEVIFCITGCFWLLSAFFIFFIFIIVVVVQFFWNFAWLFCLLSYPAQTVKNKYSECIILSVFVRANGELFLSLIFF